MIDSDTAEGSFLLGLDRRQLGGIVADTGRRGALGREEGRLDPELADGVGAGLGRKIDRREEGQLGLGHLE